MNSTLPHARTSFIKGASRDGMQPLTQGRSPARFAELTSATTVGSLISGEEIVPPFYHKKRRMEGTTVKEEEETNNR